MCHLVTELFTRNPQTQERHAPLWAQIDHYYKQRLLDDVTYEQIYKTERKSKEFVRQLTPEEKAKGLKNTGLDGLSND